MTTTDSSVSSPLAMEGILFFPITPFGPGGGLVEDVLAAHVESRLAHGPGAVFVACGTGEFHALSVEEVGAAATVATDTVAGRVPVIAGCGGPFGHARAVAAVAQEAGVDGLLVLPPYLVSGPPAGTLAYVDAVAAATDLPLIVYDRDTARFDADVVAQLCERPQVVGFKDGRGDPAVLQDLARVVAASGRSDFLCFNGLPTAELSQAAARAVGFDRYSSAVFAMAPDLALAYHAAQDDEPRRVRLLDAFFRPFVRLRDRVPGYGVALVKAGVGLDGLEVGGVRPPLVDPTPAHRDALVVLLADGRRALGEHDEAAARGVGQAGES